MESPINGHGRAAAAASPERHGNRLAWASLIVGFISLLSSLYIIFSIPLGILGIILGFIARKGPNRRIATWGIVVSSLAIILSLFLISLFLPYTTSAPAVQLP